MADRGPSRYPLGRQMVERNDVDTRHQHTIKRPYGGDEGAALARVQESADHGIRCNAARTHVIAGAGSIGRSRAPIERLLIAWRQRLVPAALDHVEIEIDATLFVLHC